MSTKPILLWFRRDLRLADNLIVHYAGQTGKPVVPVFIWSPQEEGDWAPGGASRWWLHQSLSCLQDSLHEVGLKLIIRRGDSVEALRDLIEDTRADTVVWNRRYEPTIIQRDTQVKTALREAGVQAKSFNSSLLYEPWTVETNDGSPYQVFTPFWKKCLTHPEPRPPIDSPEHLAAPDNWPSSLKLAALELEPKINWASGIERTWTPGSKGAQQVLQEFLTEGVSQYPDKRNRPDQVGTSRLSPYLHFGEISAHQVWHTIKDHFDAHYPIGKKDVVFPYLRQIGWREFAHHLLYHFPNTPTQPLRDKFAAFPWHDNPKALAAWQKGQTGYPIVDAGMRELWETGWMHNRMRMIVGSFLVKDLLIHWLEGARWFWDTLVDADLANNTLGWQWIAGCGADAAPYFRIFNPVLQGEKYDPNGDYVRRWVPELADMPDKWLQKPWDAPDEVLKTADITLGETYPKPMVDHQAAREQALAAYEQIK